MPVRTTAAIWIAARTKYSGCTSHLLKQPKSKNRRVVTALVKALFGGFYTGGAGMDEL
jgi:hypothetical protein